MVTPLYLAISLASSEKLLFKKINSSAVKVVGGRDAMGRVQASCCTLSCDLFNLLMYFIIRKTTLTRKCVKIRRKRCKTVFPNQWIKNKGAQLPDCKELSSNPFMRLEKFFCKSHVAYVCRDFERKIMLKIHGASVDEGTY